jgi:hypothetical protein
VKTVRAIASKAWGVVRACAWWGLGLWTSLAVFFTVTSWTWLAVVLAAAVAGIYGSTRREQIRLGNWFRLPWSAKWRSTAALAVTAIVAVYYFGFVTPGPDLDWAPEQARVPHVEIKGDKIHVGNVRNFTWHTATDFTPGYYNHVYDLNALDSVFYVVASMPAWEGVAHVFVCFSFSDGQHVAISVEGRRVKGQPYRLIPSMFRQFQLIYVVGDERDVVGLRGAIWKKPVYFYPVRTTPERKRAIFLDMLERAHSLEERPEFYHLITNNCMNNITYHLRRLGGRPLPFDLQVLLTGLSDRVFYYLGYIDTDLPFAKARQAFRVDQWMQQTPLDENFSKRLRETLRKQEAAVNAEVAAQSASP